MIEIIFVSIIGAAIALWIACSFILDPRDSRTRKVKPISPEMRDEIEQNAAWWDREFRRLLVSIGERSEYSDSYVLDVQRASGLTLDGIYGPLTRRAFSRGGVIPVGGSNIQSSYPPPPSVDPAVFVKVLR